MLHDRLEALKAVGFVFSESSPYAYYNDGDPLKADITRSGYQGEKATVDEVDTSNGKIS